jgi:cation-transporting ATPase 13A1
VTVFVVNYKGRPFMSGLMENSFLIWSLAFCGGGAFLAASNYLPDFNKM